MNTILTADDCIELPTADQSRLNKVEPKRRMETDPLRTPFSTMEMDVSCGFLLQQKANGILIINDGSKEVSTDVWKRLSLVGARPVEIIDGEVLIDALLSNQKAVDCLRRATVIIVPVEAGPKVLERLQEKAPDLFERNPKILAPTVDRTQDSERRATVRISPETAEYLRNNIAETDEVVILDDVLSSSKTAMVVSKNLRAQSISVVTLLSANPKKEDLDLLAGSPIRACYAGAVTGYGGQDNWKTPAITTTSNIFSITPKAALSRANLKRYLLDDGLALDVLTRRVWAAREDTRRELGIILCDYDGTLTRDGKMSANAQEALMQSRSNNFVLPATGRSYEDFRFLLGTSDAFDPIGIFENGGTIAIRGRLVSALKSNGINQKEANKRIREAAEQAGVRFKITGQKAADKTPWKVRIRASDNDIENGDFLPADTDAAIAFADAFGNGKLLVQPSGFGDVMIGPSNMDKSRSGLQTLARTIPTLPALNQSTIAAGDGLNDVGLLAMIKRRGGTAIAVNPVHIDVRKAATLVLNSPNDLAMFLRQNSTIPPSPSVI